MDRTNQAPDVFRGTSQIFFSPQVINQLTVSILLNPW